MLWLTNHDKLPSYNSFLSCFFFSLIIYCFCWINSLRRLTASSPPCSIYSSWILEFRSSPTIFLPYFLRTPRAIKTLSASYTLRLMFCSSFPNASSSFYAVSCSTSLFATYLYVAAFNAFTI